MNQSFVEPGSNLCPSGAISPPGGVSADHRYCRETDFRFDGDEFGATGGFFLGYRWQLGAFVFGLETDIAFPFRPSFQRPAM